MLNKKLLILGCLNIFLISACSSKPDVSSVESYIKTQWANCESFKIKDVKKTNGIERGDKYQIDISYSVEATKNLTAVSEGDKMGRVILDGCPAITTINGLLLEMMDDAAKRLGHGEPMKAGEILVPKGTSYDLTNSYLMIKSEKGWVVQ